MNSAVLTTTTEDAPAITIHRAGGIACLDIRNPPVNALNRRVRRALLDALLAVRDDPHTRAVVIASEGRMFSGGGDLREIGQPDPPDSTTLSDLTELMESFPKPVVVAMQGKTIGGGVLLGMACHARIGSHDALLALPEVNLGFAPGAGGTQRLPRLVGTEAALRMVALAQPMDAAAAQAAGLLDAVVPEGGVLRHAAAAHALAIAAGQLPWRRTAALAVPEGTAPAALIARYRALATERWGDREAAQEAITLIAGAAGQAFAEGAQQERKAYLRLASSEQTRNLVTAFFAARHKDKTPETAP